MKIENGILFSQVLINYAEEESVKDLDFSQCAIMIDTIDSWYDVTTEDIPETKIIATSGGYTIKEKFEDVSNGIKKYLTEYKPITNNN